MIWYDTTRYRKVQHDIPSRLNIAPELNDSRPPPAEQLQAELECGCIDKRRITSEAGEKLAPHVVRPTMSCPVWHECTSRRDANHFYSLGQRAVREGKGESSVFAVECATILCEGQCE